MRLVTSALLGELGTPGHSQAHLDAELRGVIDVINHFHLMELFGGRDQLLDAPRHEVYRGHLYLLGKAEAERIEAERIEAKAKSS